MGTIGIGRRGLLRAALCIVRLTLVAVVVALGSAAPARADYDQAMAAIERNDYRTALQLLEPLARSGHTAARFQLGVLYAEGRGTPVDRASALMWFTCVVEGSGSLNLAISARQWQMRVAAGLSNNAVRRAQISAQGECLGGEPAGVQTAESTARPVVLPIRESTLSAVFFFPGDLILLGIQKAATSFHLRWLDALVMVLLGELGDLVVGSMSFCVWCLFIRVLFLLTLLVITADAVRERKRPSSGGWAPLALLKRRSLDDLHFRP